VADGHVKQSTCATLCTDVASGTEATTSADIEHAYRTEGDRLYYALLASSGDPDIAREAVAEAFARALASGTAIRDVRPWVWRVAFRITSSELRDRKRRRETPLEDHPARPEPNDLFEALEQLSERQRASIALHYYAGYSLDEIASILGTRKATIGVHLHRGRARLRELLEEDDD
jgi:RNA polymerase sigma factor (sigma-70 family)